MQTATRPPLAASTMRNARLAACAAAIGLAAALVAAPAASAEGGFGANAEVTRSDDTGKVIFVATDEGAPIDAPAGITAASPAGEAGLTFL
jgi:hypothetical protein